MRSRIISIVHIIDKLSMDGSNPSSCAILLGEWISHLDRRRFDVGVCSLRGSDPGGQFLEAKGVKVYYLGFGKYSFRNLNGITEVIDEEKADIVHLHGYSAANYGRIAARRKGIRNIVHEHAVLRVLPHQYLADFMLSDYTDSAVAVSGSVKDFMIRGRSIPASKITVMWNGISLDKYRKCNRDIMNNKRSELGIPDDFRVVGTVTRLREEKGTEYLIRAMPLLLTELPKLYLLIVGDGPLRGKLERIADDLNVSRHLRFLGFRTDLAELLSLFDVNVIPSLTEGFGLSLIEAMSVGNVLVVTNVGGLKEIAIDGETALFVPPQRPGRNS